MPDYIPALARLAAEAGSNLTEGQTVVLSATLGQEELARAIAGACYDLGARYVEVNYSDPYVRRVRLTRASEDALGDIPPWTRRKLLDVEELGGAAIALTGPVAPHLLDDIDPGRIGRDQVVIPEQMEVIARQRLRWTIVPGPTRGWADLVFGADQPDGLERLWEQIGLICRLDADDPVQAWRARGAELGETADRLNRAELDSLRFTGPGTDLTVGLLPGAHWEGGGMTSADGVPYLPNIPTEEVFTSPIPSAPRAPSPRRDRCSSPGAPIGGLRMRFEDGRAVEVDADEGGELMRELVGRDENANRLGEVALVDSQRPHRPRRPDLPRHPARRERRQPHRRRRRLPASLRRGVGRAGQHVRDPHGLHDRRPRDRRDRHRLVTVASCRC